jgi:hypothetical protein
MAGQAQIHLLLLLSLVVIPAKAGIQRLCSSFLSRAGSLLFDTAPLHAQERERTAKSARRGVAPRAVWIKETHLRKRSSTMPFEAVSCLKDSIIF